MKIIHVSEGNTKLGKVPSISLPPILTCSKDAPCTKGECYMIPLLKLRPRVKKAYEANYESYLRNSEEYFTALNYWLYINNPRLFRFHVGGDIPDQQYLDNIINIASINKSIKFLVFTKKYYLEYPKRITSNLSIVFSTWSNYDIPSARFPLAFMDDGKEDRINNVIECFSNCENCGMCWNLKKLRKNVVFKKHGRGKYVD